MSFAKKIALAIMMICVAVGVQAQTVLKGKVLDRETGETMIQSTVLVMTADTAKMVTGATTGADGSFSIKNVKNGTYVVKISYIGYHNFYRQITVNSATNGGNQLLGTVLLVPNSIELQQAVVTAQMKEVEVKEDTIIFNADAFKVPEGSVLEELIRKLPGAEVGDDGTIKINGKTVKKIMVDGKEFFGNDQNMAMKNIPTEIVDKIKSYDRQSDLSRITGIDDGEEETVIDLSIKKGMKQGWFGNADLAYGSKDRYAERLMVNRFADKIQANVIGSLNNTNSQTGGGGGRGGNNGNTTVGQVGGRLVVDLENFEVGGNVRYNYRKSDTQTYNSSQNFVSSNSSFSNSRNMSLNKSNNVNGDFKLEWKIDTLTTLLFRPAFSFGDTNNTSNNFSATFNDDPYQRGIKDPLAQIDEVSNDIKINENASDSYSDGSSYNLNGNLTLNRQLGGMPLFGSGAENGRSGRNISL